MCFKVKLYCTTKVYSITVSYYCQFKGRGRTERKQFLYVFLSIRTISVK